MPLIATSTAALPRLATPPIQRPEGSFTPWITSTSAIYSRRSDNGTQDVDYIFLFDDQKKFIVQVTSVVAACISLVMVSVTFFWFIRMRKRFRHKLIMLLIFGDWTRALWYLVFAIVSFKRGTIYTHTRFCQVAGYLIQMATEISDFSVLFISIHGATQIFKPPVSLAGGDDRLYKYRHWIYAFILLVPQIFASLPFADPAGAGYLSQGAFCTLPIRPIWYRLVLAWIPRLCIWFTILGLAIAIYTHVHREFSNFSEAFRHHSTTSTSFLSETLDGSPPLTERRRGSSPDIGLHRPSVDRGDQAPNVTSASADILTRPRPAHVRQISSVDPISSSPNALSIPTTVAPEGRRNSRVRIEVPASPVALGPESEPANPSGKRKSFSESLHSWRSPSKEAYDDQINGSSLPNSLYSERPTPGRNSMIALTTFFNSSRRVSEGAKSMSSDRSRTRSRTFSSTSRAERKHSRRVSDPMEAQMRHKRAHIRRQLRQVFVYPLVYICMWLMPFVALCITYNSKLARRPPFIINMFNNFCLCFIGAVNSIVFSLRERPWRHIEGNPSRCFWSSFCFGCNKDDDLEDDGDTLPSHHQRRPSNRWSGSTCVTNATAPAEDRPAVSATLLRPQLIRSATAPPSPANPITSIPNDEKDDEDAITPISPLTPPSPTSPRQGIATTTTTSPPLLAPPPPLISRTSLPPSPPQTSTESPTAAASSSFPPPSATHPTNTLSALSLATSAARRHIKRASVMVAASATATRETDAQRAAREMAYERLAWEREHHAANLTAVAAGNSGGPRRGSTGDIVGGDGGMGSGSRSGGGDGVFVAGSLGSGSWAEMGPAGVGTREWWERRGSEWGAGRGGGGVSP